MLRYDLYLARGLPIATGVIEGTCRHLVADRMETAGARWGLTGAEAVLRLRALRLSGDFDEHWSFHLSREYERNHAASYARALRRGCGVIVVPKEVHPLREAGKDKDTKRPRPRGKRVWASAEKAATAVIRDDFEEEESRDSRHRKTWVCLVDGDKTEIRRFQREAGRRGVTVMMVLDLIHVLGYLWDAA